MSEHCPQDGGFIGDAGCTHPNHQHSELVKGIMSGKVSSVSEAEATAALKEGFYVDAANGQRIGFGKTLLEHLDDGKHNPKDVKARKEALALAVQTVKYPDKVEWHHEGLQGRTAYVKAFDKRGVLAVSDREGKNIEFVFNVIPKRELKKRFAGTAANGNPSTATNYTTTTSRKSRGVKKEMKDEIIYGSAVALNWEAPEDGSTQVKVQLSPIGEFALHDGGKRNGTVQHCTRAAFEALVANWKALGSPDVLVDVDHASARGGSTEAAAWCNALEVDENGLQGVFNLTPKGVELVRNRSYRFVSPGWTLSPDGTPVSLCSVALTNRPNLPVKPVVNADDAGGRDPDDPNSRKDNPEMDIKKLAAALGLPETATEEEVLAAIKAMQDREAQAAAEAANAKAEEFADNAVKAGKIAANSKEAVKAAYLKSPEVAQEMLNSVAAPAPAAKLPDFGAAKRPQALNARTPGKDADPVEVYNAYMAMPEGADKDAYLAANAQAISDGYEKAQKK